MMTEIGAASAPTGTECFDARVQYVYTSHDRTVTKQGCVNGYNVNAGGSYTPDQASQIEAALAALQTTSTPGRAFDVPDVDIVIEDGSAVQDPVTQYMGTPVDRASDGRAVIPSGGLFCLANLLDSFIRCPAPQGGSCQETCPCQTGLVCQGYSGGIPGSCQPAAGTSGTGGTNGSGSGVTIGTSGTSGTNGTGTVGTSGTSGTNGTVGTSGTSGIIDAGNGGTSGTTGTNGTGTVGTTGTNGIIDAGNGGTSETSGTDGTGTVGTSGTTGTNGTGTVGTSGGTSSSTGSMPCVLYGMLYFPDASVLADGCFVCTCTDQGFDCVPPATPGVCAVVR
jgi:hypothetical protein